MSFFVFINKRKGVKMIIGEHESFVGVKKQSVVSETEFEYFPNADKPFVLPKYTLLNSIEVNSQSPWIIHFVFNK